MGVLCDLEAMLGKKWITCEVVVRFFFFSLACRDTIMVVHYRWGERLHPLLSGCDVQDPSLKTRPS